MRSPRGIAKPLLRGQSLGRGGLRGLPLRVGPVRCGGQPVELLFKAVEAVALGKTARGSAWRVGGGDETVPAPKIAFFGDETLAGAEALFQPVAVCLGGNDADLSQPAR